MHLYFTCANQYYSATFLVDHLVGSSASDVSFRWFAADLGSFREHKSAENIQHLQSFSNVSQGSKMLGFLKMLLV